MEQAQKLGGAKKKQKQVGLKKVGFCDLAGGFCDHFLIDFFHHKKMGGRRFEANFEHFLANIFLLACGGLLVSLEIFFFGSSTPPKTVGDEKSLTSSGVLCLNYSHWEFLVFMEWSTYPPQATVSPQPRNHVFFIAGLIKGNQWLSQARIKAGYVLGVGTWLTG